METTKNLFIFFLIVDVRDASLIARALQGEVFLRAGGVESASLGEGLIRWNLKVLLSCTRFEGSLTLNTKSLAPHFQQATACFSISAIEKCYATSAHHVAC